MKILSRSQIRESERKACEDGTVSLSQLMYNAGVGCARAIAEKYPVEGRRITVVCGRRNNGGDGLVVAAQLSSFGAEVSLVYPFGPPDTETASVYRKSVEKIRVIDAIPQECYILVDALFGTGFKGKLEGEAARIVRSMNSCKAVKISVDIPSGVDCDASCAPDIAFFADFTVTFIALKICFVMPLTSDYSGDVSVIDIGVYPEEFTYLTVEEPQPSKRLKNTHKGSYGTALLLCGSYGMCGAGILSARAALTSGAGMCRAFICDKNYTAFCSSVPEAVTIPVPTLRSGVPKIRENVLSDQFKKSSAFLIGCGLKDGLDSFDLVKKALLATDIPTVVDADGINCIAKDINILSRVKAPLILTPHPKEMSRLCGNAVSDILSRPDFYAAEFAGKFGCVVVLKGANTVVASPDGRIFINMTGNPGMAVAGSGDVLAGIIVSKLAQGNSPLEAALFGVYIHGRAGDLAAKRLSETSMLPSDIIEELKTLG